MRMSQNSELKPNLDLGILIGLLLTDCSVSVKFSHHATINFTNKSIDLHNLFKEKMNKLFNIKI